MFLLRLLALPITAPASGLMAIARVIQNEALSDESRVKELQAMLQQLRVRLDAGQIDEDTYDALEEEILDAIDAIEDARAEGKP